MSNRMLQRTAQKDHVAWPEQMTSKRHRATAKVAGRSKTSIATSLVDNRFLHSSKTALTIFHPAAVKSPEKAYDQKSGLPDLAHADGSKDQKCSLWPTRTHSCRRSQIARSCAGHTRLPWRKKDVCRFVASLSLRNMKLSITMGRRYLSLSPVSLCYRRTRPLA